MSHRTPVGHLLVSLLCSNGTARLTTSVLPRGGLCPSHWGWRWAQWKMAVKDSAAYLMGGGTLGDGRFGDGTVTWLK
ncbi:hypothetical protein WJX82_007646 [Trebouxia sp. C0006]